MDSDPTATCTSRLCSELMVIHVTQPTTDIHSVYEPGPKTVACIARV